MASLLGPALFRGSSKCQAGSIGNSPSAAEKGGNARPGGVKAPRRQPCQLTNGCKEEPSLVDGGVPLQLIVVDSDLGREGYIGRERRAEITDHRQENLVTTFPDSHLTACQINLLQTTEPSPPGSTPRLVGYFPILLN